MAARDALMKGKRGPVAFFFLGETLLFPHLFPIVEALAKHEDVLIDLWVSTSAHEALLRGWMQDLGPATVRLRRASGYRAVAGEAGSNPELPSKSRLLLGMVVPMLRTPVAVVAEQTSLWLPALLPLRTRFINVSHGHGSIRSRESFRRRAAWRIPVPSAGEQKALLELGFSADKVPVVGSVKSTFRRSGGREVRFAEQRPVVLYNPHWQPHRSSWWDWGPRVLQQLTAQQRFNVILAPHQRVIEGDPALRDVLAEAARHPHVVSDVDSFAMVDGSYQRAADLYLGDTSSQVIEFLARPRPCVFLNNKQVQWRARPDYAMWQAGEVLEQPDGLVAALERAITRHGDYLAAQKQLVCEWLGDTSGAPERIAGHILEALSQQTGERPA